jgi:hypothetical protein
MQQHVYAILKRCHGIDVSAIGSKTGRAVCAAAQQHTGTMCVRLCTAHPFVGPAAARSGLKNSIP